MELGERERIRTVDPLPAEQVLYQLSYSPRSKGESISVAHAPGARRRDRRIATGAAHRTEDADGDQAQRA